MIEAICEVFANHAHNTDIATMLDQVSTIIKYRDCSKGYKQSIEIVKRTFNKVFYFNPGLFESSDV